eukprot:TRINITY_DN12736_c0_g1_i1.p1 TRINITY_DN12736_c0_g1~~TRINITY_DN12736_c0_g1_i1.p1  ORF type:complete len:360 (-),score=57.83 TRINITY_DN12736_c0_g1_i1:326-1405(-)
MLVAVSKLQFVRKLSGNILGCEFKNNVLQRGMSKTIKIAAESHEDVICSQKVTIQNVGGEEADLLVDTLFGEGVQAATIEECRYEGDVEQKIYDERGEERQVWNQCNVIAWLSQDQKNIDEFIKNCLSISGVHSQYVTEQILQSNFEEQVKSEYQPIKIDQGLWIVPAWCQIVESDAMNIILRPGLAFGTGTHPTTRLCLYWLNQHASIKNKDVLDYGTGSGVLAICARLKGAHRCVGVDIDPLSIIAAKQNAQENGFSEELLWYECQPGTEEDTDPLIQNNCELRKFDVVMANILMGPLIDLAPRICNYLKPGGEIVLSGILQPQVEDVYKCYEEYITNFQLKHDGEWVLISGTAKMQ